MADKAFNATKIQEGERLPREFYIRTDVAQIARELLGKVIVTEFDGARTAGRITETEAYRAPDDRACHAYGNRRTARTEVMFHEGGRAYIYLCYGMHHLFNVVTAPADTAHAVLIRAVEPLEGLDVMMKRRGRLATDDLRMGNANRRQLTALTTGPGALAQALGLTVKWTGQSLLDLGSPVWIEDRQDSTVRPGDIAEGKRVGVEYAGLCAAWPWRFWLKNSSFVKKTN